MKEIKFSIERTVQIRQFEPVKISLEFKEEIEEDENIKLYYKAKYRLMEKLCNSMITDQINKYTDQ